MWKLPDTVARRFPLIARPRPACLPLPQRIHALAELADTAARQGDASVASTVYNQAALIASDVGAPDAARTLCHQHAAAYLHAAPLPGKTAIRALEPVVNLARLQIRAGQYDNGRRQLLALFDAVSTSAPIQVEDVAVPAELIATAEDRQEVRAWLWRVLLADGARALTAAGRWTEALAHVEAHHGVGQRMFDGRQIAVLAAIAEGNSDRAAELLEHTKPDEQWEHAVTVCLTLLCSRAAGQSIDESLEDVLSAVLGRQAEPGLSVFDNRLGLTVLDAIGCTGHPSAHRVAEHLADRALLALDGYVAREVLTHPICAPLIPNQQAQHCRDLVNACALGTHPFPEALCGELAAALRMSDRVIRAAMRGPAGSSQRRQASIRR
ncbi:hypothetical protein PV367_20620 [Streptomyces europaeiscabiei]|uniref:Uncharacterized protein n=1 Tax=Streptomyces europaeiscabiei TaxID=146819 RepID=A0AAJ2PRF4_9ACTN|nr:MULTISPECIES: hypothetical protein [Streptomyces]KFF98024.1 hypothetical protein IQ62_27310 [Streptomyces scabiei]MDX3132142.1 hypothetical protein [Streptomyces europaeiscabiei]